MARERKDVAAVGNGRQATLLPAAMGRQGHLFDNEGDRAGCLQ